MGHIWQNATVWIKGGKENKKVRKNKKVSKGKK